MKTRTVRIALGLLLTAALLLTVSVLSEPACPTTSRLSACQRELAPVTRAEFLRLFAS